jgi:hypothetical protein
VPRKKSPPPEAPALPPAIHPTACYDLSQARYVLNLADSTLQREIGLGRLRHARRAGKVLLLGQWLIDWLEQGAERPACACADGPLALRTGE